MSSPKAPDGSFWKAFRLTIALFPRFPKAPDGSFWNFTTTPPPKAPSRSARGERETRSVSLLPARFARGNLVALLTPFGRSGAYFGGLPGACRSAPPTSLNVAASRHAVGPFRSPAQPIWLLILVWKTATGTVNQYGWPSGHLDRGRYELDQHLMHTGIRWICGQCELDVRWMCIGYALNVRWMCTGDTLGCKREQTSVRDLVPVLFEGAQTADCISHPINRRSITDSFAVRGPGM
jgi:hypothetical protein